jgi:phosphosulfolactate synthase (CoM biosynthesis protein A)
MGHHIDGLKFAGGSFSLFPEDKLRELIDLAHEHGVYVSTVFTLPSTPWFPPSCHRPYANDSN